MGLTWLGWQDSNLRMPESKSGALPTWLHPNAFLGLAHLGGFEPPAHGLEVRCSILLSYSCIIGAGEGNRTLATSLEGWGSTTELHPQYADNNGKTNFINH